MKWNPKHRKRPDNPFTGVEKTVSSTECTGLMPWLPQNDLEQENLAQLYSIHDANPKRNEE